MDVHPVRASRSRPVALPESVRGGTQNFSFLISCFDRGRRAECQFKNILLLLLFLPAYIATTQKMTAPSR